MNRTTSIALSLVLLSTALMAPFISQEARAGDPIFSASYRILEGDAASNTHLPADMAVDPDGRLYLLYEGNPEFYYGAYLTHSDDEGLTWSEPTRVDNILRDGNESNDVKFMEHRTHPRMDIGPDGTVYVVWTDHSDWNEEAALTHPRKIRMSVSADGSSFTDPVRVSPPPSDRTQDALRPDITVNDNGRVIVVWLDERDVGSRSNIYSSYSDDGGDSWSSLVRINTDNMYDHDIKPANPRIVSHQEHVYVTWDDNRDDRYGTKPFVAVSQDGGETFADEVFFVDDLVEDNVREDAYPVVTSSGDLFIAWTDQRSQRREIWYVTSRDNGGNFSADRRLATPPADTEDMNPYVSYYGAERIFVLWEREESFINKNGNPGLEKDIFYKSSTDFGNNWDQFLRVDDSDRYSEDRKDQDYPAGTYALNGRAICSYGNSPYSGGYTRQLMVTRHSRTLTGETNLPVMLDTGFGGDAGFNRRMGNTSTVFTFNMTYRDADNDEPREGFPRVTLYNDMEGTDPVFDQPSVMDKVLGDFDIYYMDGVDYQVNLTLPEEGRYYWAMEVSDESDSEIISTPVLPGPIIDMTMPDIEILSPEPEVWNSSREVLCRIRVTDTGGAGVDPGSIKYQKALNGPDKFNKGVHMTDIHVIDNDTVEASAEVIMNPGRDNYLRFEARDRLKNGPSMTGSLNMWLDPDAPYFEDARPLSNDTKIYPDVNCSITVRDRNEGNTMTDVTGVDPTALRFAYKTTSGEFSEWLEPEGYVEIENGSYRVWTTITFPDEGVHSRIKWLALDKIGNRVESREFSVSVDVPENYRPVFKGRAWPTVVVSSTPHFWWEPAYDEENDPLYYRAMILKNNLNWVDWVDVDLNTFYDLADPNALDPGHYVLRIEVTDRLGGKDTLDHHFQIKERGTPPPSRVDPFGPYFTDDPVVTVSWNETDVEDATYRFRIGSAHLTGDVLPWQDVGSETSYDLSDLSLDVGSYSLQVMAWANGNFSRVRTALFKYSRYQVEIDVPFEHLAYRGKGYSISGPIEGRIINDGPLSDNVTLILEGEGVEAGWIYFESNGETMVTLETPSSMDLEEPLPSEFDIIIAPDEKSPRRDYALTLRAISEDGSTEVVASEITIRVEDAPSDETSSPLTEDITDVLPFLEKVPESLVIPIFFLIILIIVAVIAAVGILIVKVTSGRKKSGDPLKDKIRNYKEIYGEDPAEEEILRWKEELESGETPSVTEEIEKEAATEEEATGDELDGSPEEGEEVTDVKEKEVSKEDELLDRLFD